MIYHIVLSHKQTEYINKFPENSVFVFDDPSEEDIIYCKRNNITYVISSEKGNRSINRNTGISFILSNYKVSDNDIIEFFDGDRYPTTYNFEKVLELIENNSLDIMLYTCKNDMRLSKIYVPIEGAAIIDTGTMCNPFYSCGFAIKISAIKKIQEINNGNLFEPSFIYWGGEDQYLGLLCDKLNLKVAITTEVTLNGNVGGDAVSHSNYRETLQNYVNLIIKNNIPIRNEARDAYIIK